ncbi:MAG: DUF4956 domain-containing protein [Nitrospira sp.]
MNPYLMLADIVAIAILVIAFYMPRKGRRELVSSFLVTNIGVLAVATAMSAGTVAAGLGLGLFGVLSIIRLRSEELSHREIAYYFAALSLGLLGGLSGLPLLWSIGLMTLVLVAIAVGDHPRITARSKSAELIIDEAITDPAALQLRASELLGATVTDIKYSQNRPDQRLHDGPGSFPSDNAEDRSRNRAGRAAHAIGHRSKRQLPGPFRTRDAHPDQQ